MSLMSLEEHRRKQPPGVNWLSIGISSVYRVYPHVSDAPLCVHMLAAGFATVTGPTKAVVVGGGKGEG